MGRASPRRGGERGAGRSPPDAALALHPLGNEGQLPGVRVDVNDARDGPAGVQFDHPEAGRAVPYDPPLGRDALERLRVGGSWSAKDDAEGGLEANKIDGHSKPLKPTGTAPTVRIP